MVDQIPRTRTARIQDATHGQDRVIPAFRPDRGLLAKPVTPNPRRVLKR